MLFRIATVLAGSAALALTVPATAADPDDSRPTCSATVTDNCIQRSGHATSHHTATHKARRHKATHRRARHHTMKHHAVAHHTAKHHAMHHPASTKTSVKTAAGTTTTHTVAPTSGHMAKSSTTVHKTK
jgi:hypothetical protein